MLKIIRNVAIVILSLVLLFALLICCINLRVKTSGKSQIYSLEKVPESSAILVFGASVYGNSVSDILARRLDTAIDIYKLNKADKIIVSGDHSSSDYNEVKAMKEYLCERGIPEEAVFMDHSGLETYDSVYRAKNVFKENSVIMVSQELHIIRALYIADRIGLKAYGVSCGNYSNSELKFQKKREFFARMKAFVQCEVPPLYDVMWEKDNKISSFVKKMYNYLEKGYENNN